MIQHKNQIEPTTSRRTLAQMTVIGLLMVFLGIMVLSSLMDTITTNVDTMTDNLTAAGYTEEAVLTHLIPLFIIIVFLATIAMYGAAQQQ